MDHPANRTPASFPPPVGHPPLSRSEAALGLTVRKQFSEERYRRFFSDCKAVMLLIDPVNGRIVDANHAASAYYGYEPETLRRMSIGDINTLSPDEWEAEMGRATQEARSQFYFRHRRADGSARDVMVYSGPFEVGDRTLLYSIVHDITEQRQTEARLAQRESYQRALLDTFPFHTWLKDTDSRFLAVNQPFAKASGFACAEEMIGKTDHDLWGPEIADEYVLVDREVLSSRQQRVYEEVVVENGVRKWYETYKGPVLAEDGSLLGTVGFSRDISERRQIEEQQRLAANVFNHSHDGIVITDASQRILDVNATFCALTGYTREEVVGRTPRILKSDMQSPEFYIKMWEGLRKRGYWRGEIWNRRKSGEVYAEQLTISAVRDGEGGVSHYVGVFSDITQAKQHEKELERIAHFDALTQLPNRVLLGDRLQVAIRQAERSGKLLGVAYLDLDGFKQVNDTQGHDAGDRLLTVIAHRLTESLRSGDTVARLGGDEFVMLLGDLSSVDEAERALQRVLKAIAQPVPLGDHTTMVSASIGLTVYPSDGSDSDTLLRHADQAMYHAKELGRNQVHLFDAAHGRRMQEHRDARLRIEQALERGEFELYYQPKVDMEEGRVIGAEALIRWNHPEKGVLGPGAFLPYIETSELIVRVGNWVLEEALLQMAAWRRAGLHLPVSVNVAPLQLQASDFCERLSELLEAYPELPPGSLQLEVLESAALEDMARVGQIIQDCQRMGVHFALDDFGTGYSTLTYLKRLPAGLLKIEKSFVGDMLDDPEAQAIVNAVIGLAQAFQRSVIAEGAETPEHCAMLKRMGCKLAQGYGIARPMPAPAVGPWVEAFRPHPLWA